MALISRLCSKNRLTKQLFLRQYGSAAAITAYDHDSWDYAFPLAALAAAQAGGHMVGRGTQWVFIGSPGVEKSAYANKLAELLNVPHISMGNLVREELREQSSLSKQLSAAVSQGKLLPDNIIFKLLSKRWELGDSLGETGFILDGFPRTRIQAKILDRVADIDMAINFKCKEEDNLIKRCLGRRTCSQCGRTFNVANTDTKIHISPVRPPCTCLGKLVTSTNDTEEILKEKLRIYSEQSKALEDHYHKQKKLLNFEVPGDKQETWTGLLAALELKDVDKTFQQLTC